jgi:hypothetical protein
VVGVTRGSTTVAAWRRVLEKTELQEATGCLIFGGHPNPDGYAKISVPANAVRFVHRVIFEALVGPIPAGLQVGHHCHDLALAAGECPGGDSCLHRRCVHPGRLALQTPRENVLASAGPTARRAGQTHTRTAGQDAA